jgi:putative ABC transport system permease protein
MVLSSIEIKEAIGMGLASLRANKFRASLTILGVMIGVASVIALASIISGMNLAMNQEIDSLGSNTIYVTKFSMSQDHDDMTEEERQRKPITINEAKAVMANCPSIDAVSPQNYYFRPGGNEIKYLNRKGNSSRVMGTWPDYVNVNLQELAQGRFINELDELHKTNVCVLGSKLADALFEGDAASEKEIRINGVKFLVVGVMKEFKSNFGDDGENNTALIPLSTFERLYPWEKELFLAAKAESFEKLGKAQEELINALRIERGDKFGKPNSFEVATQETFKELAQDIAKYLYIAMLIITSVGLMVGGIGVMNIMLVSVTERTREIGIRKAIGAKRSNILIQFLTEAMTLSGFGGVVGIVLGLAIGILVQMLLDWPATVSITWAIIGFLTSTTVGLVSGMYPALKASRLDPIEALRYE